MSIYEEARPFDVAVTEIDERLKSIADKADILIDDAEKDIVSALEAEFVEKQGQLQATVTRYSDKVTELAKKYGVTPESHFFDVTTKVFKAR